jgi:SHS2 domain-containing protein
MFDTFDHKADLGLRIQAGDLDTLFSEAARALFSAVVEDLSAILPTQKIEVTIQGDDLAYLLFDWLNELLYRFDTGHLLFGRFEVHVSDGHLTGAAWGEVLDPARHALSHEVKAITYHGLKVEQTTDGWLAEMIVDI